MACRLLLVGFIGLSLTVAVVSACGGTVEEGKVINGTKDLPANVTKDTECIWFFDQEKNDSMYIYFKDFIIQPGDTFTVYNGASEDGRDADKLITLSGSVDPSLVVFTTQSKVQLKFTGSDGAPTSKRSFIVSYSLENCVVPLEKHSSISAPIYLPQPQKTINCTYDFSSNTSGLHAALDFSRVNITKGSLRVWDTTNTTSTKPVIDSENPTSIQQDVISDSGKIVMEVVITTSRPNQTLSAGFITGHTGCFKTIEVDGPMTLMSPGYPSKYTSHLSCKWILKVPENKTDYSIKAMFADLDLSSTNKRVTVNAGGSRSSPNLGVFTQGSPLDHVMVSGNGMMYIELDTDETPGGRGFNMAIDLSPYDKALFGSGQIGLFPEMNVTSDSEDIAQGQSPATAGDDIFYQLIAEDGKKVELTINRTDLIIFPTSVISIHDGNNPTTPLLAQFSTHTAFFKVQSSGQNMLIILQGFKRNGTITRQTFAADFKSVQEESIVSLSDDAGTILLNSSSNLANRTWIINSYNSANEVALHLNKLDLSPGDVLNIYDTPSSYNKIVVLRDDVTNLPVVYAKHMRIEYVLKSSPKKLKTPALSHPILSASYQQVGACGGQVSGTKGDLVSPEWPNRYPYNAKCSWTFQPVRNSTLHLAFPKFALFQEHSLTVTVRNYYTKQDVNITDTVLAKLTGEDTPNDIMINMDVAGIGNLTSRELVVEFSSKYQGESTSAQVGQGFQIKYEYLNSACSKNVTNATSISTPNFPNPIKSNLSCLWIISEPLRDAKVNTTVNVLQYTVNLQHVTLVNSSNSLEIHDGGALTSRIVPVKVTEGKSDSMESRTSQLWVKYSYTKTNSTKEGFAFQLNFKKYGCPLDKQCANGLCMQDSWVCNGIDDCGDMSDEKDCTCTAKGGKKQYSGLVLGMAILGTMILTLILAFAIPIIYKRIKYPNYSELRDLMAPVDS